MRTCIKNRKVNVEFTSTNISDEGCRVIARMFVEYIKDPEHLKEIQEDVAAMKKEKALPV